MKIQCLKRKSIIKKHQMILLIIVCYILCLNEVTFLISEDNGIHKNARKLNEIKDNFEDRVFTINEALIYFGFVEILFDFCKKF